MLANCWRQIELVSILANFFANFFVLANSNLTCERLANVCCYLSTNQNTRFSHVICVTLHKMADEDRDATFKFIEEIHNNPVSSARSSWTRVLYTPREGFLEIYGFVQISLFRQRFLFFLRRLTQNNSKTQAATLRCECHWTMSAMLQIGVCFELTRV